MPTQWQAGYATGQSWTGKDWMTASSTLGVDPYLIWADTTNFVELGGLPIGWVSVILELGIDVPAFARKVQSVPWIKLHPRYATASGALAATTFCTALVAKTFFEELHAGAAVLSDILRFELGQPIVKPGSIDTAPVIAPRGNPHVAEPSASCVVGIIDDGFAFAHERFLDANGTRIDYLWDQGYFSPALTQAAYGREYTNADLNQYIGQANEDAAYRTAGYREVRRRVAHGTVMADLASGAQPSDVAFKSTRMICVQLQTPSRRTRDRSAGWLAVRVLDGLRYILENSENAAPQKPVAVNLSFGNIAGPHDGSSIIEAAIDDLITRMTADRLAVVFAVGNSNLVRCHAKFDLAVNATREITWRVLPDDPTPNFMEIWFPRDADEKLEIKVTTPTGDTSDVITRDNVAVWGPTNDALCTVVYRDNVATGKRRMVLLCVAPTSDAGRNRPTAPCGEWIVCVKNVGEEALTIDAWIQRDETPFNFPRHGRQSRFEDPNYLRFEPAPGSPAYVQCAAQGRIKVFDAGSPGAYVKREGTMNSLATGKYTLVAGGYRLSNGTAAPYSSSGPGLPWVTGALPYKAGPDAGAVSDDSIVLGGIIAAGARSGSAIAMDGTSVSAAQVTRWAASVFAMGGQTVDRAKLWARASADEAARPGHYKPLPLPNRLGVGRMLTPPELQATRKRLARRRWG